MHAPSSESQELARRGTQALALLVLLAAGWFVATRPGPVPTGEELPAPAMPEHVACTTGARLEAPFTNPGAEE